MRTTAQRLRIGLAALVAVAALTAMSTIAGAKPARAATEQATDLGGSSAPLAIDASTGRLPDGWRGEMLSRINAIRADAGLAPLSACSSLRRAAQGHASSMATTHALSHIGPDGTWPWDRMRAEGFRLHAAAENLAEGQNSVDQVLREWLSSPPHRANLMDPRMQQAGFGFASDATGTGRGYWVQDFGRGRGC